MRAVDDHGYQFLEDKSPWTAQPTMDITASTHARPRIITFGSIDDLQSTLAATDIQSPATPPAQKEKGKSKDLRIKTDAQSVAMQRRTRSATTMMFGSVEALPPTSSPTPPLTSVGTMTATGKMSRSRTEYSESSSEASSSPETVKWRSQFNFNDDDVSCRVLSSRPLRVISSDLLPSQPYAGMPPTKADELNRSVSVKPHYMSPPPYRSIINGHRDKRDRSPFPRQLAGIPSIGWPKANMGTQ